MARIRRLSKRRPLKSFAFGIAAVRYNWSGHEPIPARTLRIEPVLERAGALRRRAVRALPGGPVERQPGMARVLRPVRVRRAPAAGPAPARPAPQPAQPSTAAPAHPTPTTDVEKQSSVSRLIQFYANRGHLIADIDPLGLMQRPMPRVLDPAYVGLTEADMDTVFHTASRTSGVDKQMKLSEILKQLRHIYTGRIGAEFAHVSTSEERLWLQDRFQDGHAPPPLHQRRTPEPALAAHRGRGARALPAHALRGPEALFARGRRRADRAARRRRATQRRAQASRKS